MSSGSILDLIGNTPLVPITRLNPNPQVTILAKLESFNPGGSIKDRVALAMVRAAELSGELSGEKTIIEATSGNTGIGLAMVCAVKGYRLLLLMPENASEERKRIMKAYGAEIHLTPGHLGTDGAIEEAYRLAREQSERYVLMDQFNNPASIEAHSKGTTREIWEQTKGEVTHVVASLGTSGTAMGFAEGFPQFSPQVTVTAVEPYVGHKIQGLKNMQASYPPGIFDRKRLHRILHVEDEHAFSLCRQLAEQEGIFAGMSSGAALGGALSLAEELQSGLIVVVFPDGGERYLSTSLFATKLKSGLKLFNVKSKEPEYLDLQSPPLCLFAPGPSPERPGELEAWRRIVFLDVLSRYLGQKGISHAACVGLADMDDQALKQARACAQSLPAFSKRLRQELAYQGRALAVDEAGYCPASSKQDLMLELSQNLLDKGRGYEKLRSVYYDVFRDPDYGSLLGADLNKLSLGKTVDLESYAKENPRDFTLLKRTSLQELKSGDFLKTKWGNVRPSWYLQMAASPGRQSLSNLRVVFSGSSQQFPHLENLRAIWSKAAQSEPQIWMVVQAVSGARENVLLPEVRELLPALENKLILRLWLLSNAYRKTLVLSEDNLSMWTHNWRRVQGLAANMFQIAEASGEVSKEVDQELFNLKSGFADCLEDDLSLYRFWPVLFEMCKRIQARFAKKELTPLEAKKVLSRLQEVDAVLRIIDWEEMPLEQADWPPDVAELLRERQEAKKRRDFARADELRDQIRKAGFSLEDSPYGPRLFRIE